MARPLFICFLLLTAAPSLVARMQGAPCLAAGAELTADDMRNAAALVGNLPAAFQLFKTVFGREYNADGEEETRFRNFATNIANAVAAFAQNPTATYGATPFSDMSEEEFANSVLNKDVPAYVPSDPNAWVATNAPAGEAHRPRVRKMDAHGVPIKDGIVVDAKTGKQTLERVETPFAELPPAYVHRRAPLTNGMDARTARRDAFKALADDLPAKFDWRPHNILQKVKYQGACGSCWAFVVTGSIESQWALAGHGLPNLSEQQLISCDNTNYACDGGVMQYAFQWILRENDGYVASVNYYPQTSFEKERPAACNNVGAGAAAKITNFIDIPKTEEEIRKYTVNVGPVVVAIEANNWQHYTGGIMSGCRNWYITHAVLVVGYDTTHDPPYWILKNSWSTQWGENGYARLRMGANECLITNNPSIAVVPDKSFDVSSLPTGDPARYTETTDFDPNSAPGSDLARSTLVAATGAIAAIATAIAALF